MITERLLEVITIKDLCVVTGRKKILDQNGNFIGLYEPKYIFSPTLAAETFMKYFHIYIKDNYEAEGIYDGQILEQKYLNRIIFLVCSNICGDLINHNKIKPLWSHIRALPQVF